MNTKLFLSVFTVIFLFITAGINAQITIGCDAAPVPGALLELKQSGTTNRGLGLPRVKLTTIDKLYPMLSNGYAATEDAKHEGLLVYAIEKFGTPANCPGLYVWDGGQWVPLMNGSSQARETATHVYDHEGNAYTKHTFGSAGTWMTQNLRVKSDPCKVPFEEGISSDLVTLSYAYPKINGLYTNGKPTYWKEEYGLLYNWATATNGKGGAAGDEVHNNEGEGRSDVPGQVNNHPENLEEKGVQGICPNGWHLPSDKEWNALEEELATHPSVYSTWATADPATDWTITASPYDPGINKLVLKRSANLLLAMTTPDETFNGPSSTISSYTGKSKTDGTGFNVMYVGYGAVNQNIYQYGKISYFWTSSAADKDGVDAKSWYRHINDDDIKNIGTGGVHRRFGQRGDYYSVRCKKD